MAEQPRITAAASLTEKMRDLTKYKDKEKISMRLLQSKYDTVQTANDELMTKHYAYGEKAKKDVTSEEMVEWLSPKLDLAGDLLDEVFVMLEEAASKTHDEEARDKKAALEEVNELKKREDLRIYRR